MDLAGLYANGSCLTTSLFTECWNTFGNSVFVRGVRNILPLEAFVPFLQSAAGVLVCNCASVRKSGTDIFSAILLSL